MTRSLNQSATLQNMADTTAINAGVDSSMHRLNVLNNGVSNSTTVDSAPAIQSAINAVAAEIVTGVMTTSRTIIFPGGRYRLNSQIIQPPYVKVQFESSTILETYVNGSAWWITPLSSDPTTLASSLQKQQWMWGSIFGAAAGAVVFVNLGVGGSSSALELGPRSDLGPYRPMARYAISDVAIQGYATGVLWNAFNNYVGSFHRFHIENCTTAVQYGAGVHVVNSGEKINWYDSIFASGATAHHFMCDTVSIQLFGCSIDYVTNAFLIDAISGYNSIDMYGGHLEGINSGSVYVAGRHGIAVSDLTADYLRLGLHGVPFVTGTRSTQFYGLMRLHLDMDYRSTDLASTTITTLCDPSVTITALHFDRHGQGSRISEALNIVRDPAFMADTVGATTFTNWGAGLYNATAQIVAYGSSQAIQVSTTGSGYITIFPKMKAPIRAGQRVRIFLSGFKPAGGANFTGHVRFYDMSGAEISRTIDSTFVMPSGILGQWTDPASDLTAYAPNGTAQCAPYFTASSSVTASGIMLASPYATIE